MFDAKGLLDQVMGTVEKYAGKENIDALKEKAKANPTATKVAGIGAAGVLLGTRAGRGLLKLGGLAAVGGLAYKAYNDWQAKQGGQLEQAEGGAAGEIAPPPADSAFDHSGTDANERAIAYITAMISAAKADGKIDADEQERIFGKVKELTADSEARAFLMDEMMAPVDLDKVAKLARTREEAAEIYTASAMAITLDTAAERKYLDMLASRLGLDAELAKLIEQAVEDEQMAV